MIRALVVGLVLGGVVFALRLALVGRSLFRIRVGAGEVSLRGRVPGHAYADVRDFVGTLELPRGAWIRGIPDADRFRLEFSKNVPADRRQQLRNYLFLHV